MAATILIEEMSALATGVDKTNGTVRFKAADNNTVDGNNPLVVPASGSIYSYTKKVRAYMSVAPSVNVQNLRWYSDGSNSLARASELRQRISGRPGPQITIHSKVVAQIFSVILQALHWGEILPTPHHFCLRGLVVSW